MDRAANYRRIIRRLVRDYAQYRPSNIRRIHATIFHLRLRNGEILIEEDGLPGNSNRLA